MNCLITWLTGLCTHWAKISPPVSCLRLQAITLNWKNQYQHHYSCSVVRSFRSPRRTHCLWSFWLRWQNFIEQQVFWCSTLCEVRTSDYPLSRCVRQIRSSLLTHQILSLNSPVRYCIWTIPSSLHYIAYCEACGRELNEALQEDLNMMCTYDSEMFCFTLPTIYSEYAISGSFNITNNISLIHKTVSSLDPVSLQEIICLCLTGTCKIFNRDNPRSAIGKSRTFIQTYSTNGCC